MRDVVVGAGRGDAIGDRDRSRRRARARQPATARGRRRLPAAGAGVEHRRRFPRRVPGLPPRAERRAAGAGRGRHLRRRAGGPRSDGARHDRRTVPGCEPVAVPVDDDGIDVDALAASGARAVVVTPAHQCPTGVVLSAERRLALIEWARRVDGYVIEDDYDAEFRYDRQPVGSLQGLAPDRVLGMGSVSKTLAPMLRIGWIACPPALRRSRSSRRSCCSVAARRRSTSSRSPSSSSRAASTRTCGTCGRSTGGAARPSSTRSPTTPRTTCRPAWRPVATPCCGCPPAATRRRSSPRAPSVRSGSTGWAATAPSRRPPIAPELVVGFGNVSPRRRSIAASPCWARSLERASIRLEVVLGTSVGLALFADHSIRTLAAMSAPRPSTGRPPRPPVELAPELVAATCAVSACRSRERPSAAALARLHRAHVERVPYETFWIHLGEDAGTSIRRGRSSASPRRAPRRLLLPPQRRLRLAARAARLRRDPSRRRRARRRPARRRRRSATTSR